MPLSTKKSEVSARVLKDMLEFRGFTVTEETITNGRKLILDTDKLSIRLTAQDAVSKDIFGLDTFAYTPTDVRLAINTLTASHTEAVKVMMELGKKGFALRVGEDEGLEDAETASDAAEILEHNVTWPTKGS